MSADASVMKCTAAMNMGRLFIRTLTPAASSGGTVVGEKRKRRVWIGWTRGKWDWADMLVVNRRREKALDDVLGEAIKVEVREVRPARRRK